MFIKWPERAKHYVLLGYLRRDVKVDEKPFLPSFMGQEVQATQGRQAVGIKLAQSVLERSCIVGHRDKGSIKETEFTMSLDHWIKF